MAVFCKITTEDIVVMIDFCEKKFADVLFGGENIKQINSIYNTISWKKKKKGN